MSGVIEETEVGSTPGQRSTGDFSTSQSESLLDALSKKSGDVIASFDRLVARMAEQNAAVSEEEVAADVAAATQTQMCSVRPAARANRAGRGRAVRNTTGCGRARPGGTVRGR